MRRVVTVSLNGNAYQFEDDAYALLSNYLDAAARALASNPDKEEIVADLEQAIADKCTRYLSAHKSVVARDEIERVLAEMGPVADEDAPGSRPGPAAAPGAAAQPTAEPAATRRLYQISDGALISGVCNGFAAFFGIDVTVVRVVFVALVFLTGGLAILAYLVLMFVVPYAETSEEHAAARGLPFNARALVERAKRQAADLANGADWHSSREEWKREWRASREEWRAEWRRMRAEWRGRQTHMFGRRSRRRAQAFQASAPPARAPYAAHVITGLVLAILSLFLAVFTVACIAVLVSLLMTGAVFGWLLPPDVPFWAAIVILIVVYQLVAWPIRAARMSAYHPAAVFHRPWVALWDGLIGVLVFGVVAYYLYHHIPEVHAFFDHLTRAWDRAVET